MQSIFETPEAATNPEFLKKYMVKTQTKGTLFFDELPRGTYFLMGIENSPEGWEVGKATYMTFDNGTCLIPIYDTTTGKQVQDINKAGTEIN